MADFSNLIATINANIKENGNEEITGQVLNSVLIDSVNAIGREFGVMLEIGLCDEDGIFFVDSYLNIGVQIDTDGIAAINLITMEEI